MSSLVPFGNIIFAFRRPTTYLGHVRELVATGVCAAMYPFGVGVSIEDPGAPLRPVLSRTSAPISTTPVLLVHGYGHNSSGWIFLHRHLKKAGFERVFSMDYGPLCHDVPAQALALARRVELIRATTGVDRVHLVGHSLGGILIRYYVQLLGGDERVETAITVASPHEGTLAAHMGLGMTIPQLQPGSWVVEALRDTARRTRVRWVAYYSNLDLLVQPTTSAMLRQPALGATNVLVQDHGHLSLLLSPAVGRSIAHHLAVAEGLDVGPVDTDGVGPPPVAADTDSFSVPVSLDPELCVCQD
jgi:pimeloyl-ACP methyl ester carboxylesterase